MHDDSRPLWRDHRTFRLCNDHAARAGSRVKKLTEEQETERKRRIAAHRKRVALEEKRIKRNEERVRREMEKIISRGKV